MKLPSAVLSRVFDFLKRRVASRKPDLVIGGEESPYLRRWFVLPCNRLFNVYLHQFLRSDDDRALHDHPWMFNGSLLLAGAYREHTIATGGIHRVRDISAGEWKLRWAAAPHRISLLPLVGTADLQPCWTLFVTGPVVRSWGFHCPHVGWVHWSDFTADGGATTGKGCDQ